MTLKIRELNGFEDPDKPLERTIISLSLFDSYLITSGCFMNTNPQYSFAF